MYLRLQIDSRFFGNVGSFIRLRPTSSTGTALNVFSIDDDFSGDSSSGGVVKMYEKMLEKRLVYTNFRPDGSGPKLALFAARSISANSELFL